MRLHPSVSLALLVCGPAWALPPAPSPEALKTCVESWKPEYRQSHGFDLETWTLECKKGLSPDQILASHAARRAVAIPAPAIPPPAMPSGSRQSESLSALGQINETQGPAALYGEHAHEPGAGELGPTPGGGVTSAGAKLAAPFNPDAHLKVEGGTPPMAGATATETIPEYKGPGWYQSLAALVAKPVFPYGKALTAYLDMTGLSNYSSAETVGGSNEGLNKFYSGLAEKDPVYVARLEEFYGRVRTMDSVAGNDHRFRPNLGQAAGAGRRDKVPPGWLWKEAMDVAKGDPNEAMRLIGFCGHDDAAHGYYMKLPTRAEAEAKLASTRARLTELIAGLEEVLASSDLSESVRSAKTRALERTRDALADTTIAHFLVAQPVRLCPGDRSFFYLPGSLDASADIPVELKRRVARSEKKGETRLAHIPAKSYHIMGGAAAACELIRNGAPPWLAVLIQTNAGRMYRTLRMHSEARNYAGVRKSCSAAYEFYKSGLAAGAPAVEEAGFRDVCLAKSGIRGELLAEYDAYELMELWGFGLEMGDESYPVDIRVGILQGKIRRSRPKGWSDERLAAARTRMQGAFVEQRWTTAEHKAGAEFAAKVCKAQP